MIDMATSRSRLRAQDRSAASRSAAALQPLINALLGGGDSRIALTKPDGPANKYLCPPFPDPDLLCAASCTASPVSTRGFQRAADFFTSWTAEPLPRQQSTLADQTSHDLAARLLTYFGATSLAEVVLCPSGTDAMQTATLIIAQQYPDQPLTAILPQASETGSGVPHATRLLPFDTPSAADRPLANFSINTVEIPLRAADGLTLGDDEIVDAFAAATASAIGRPIVYLTHGTKTGLIAPVVPPSGADVIVDACQARIEPAIVIDYLRLGWPVVVTGSKFFGGPAFSGAILLPSGRFTHIPPGITRLGLRPTPSDATTTNIGMLLRWLAAIDTFESFAPIAPTMPERLIRRAAAIEEGLARLPALIPIPGLSTGGTGWSDIPTIFTFAVRDPADPRRRLTTAQLRPLYTALARDKVLLGQPVDLGQFGGLRIAVGARDFLPNAPQDGDLPRLFAALDAATAQLQNPANIG